MRPVEFWFDFSSPYAYFAAMTLDRRERLRARAFLWRPFLLGVVYQISGMAPLPDQPLRGAYALHDWQRLAKFLNVPLHEPAPAPYRSQPVARAFYWFEEQRPELAVPFAKLAFAKRFYSGADLSSPTAVIEACKQLLKDTGELETWLHSQMARDKLKAMCSEAIAKGVFGSPFFIADGEPFWGWDRLELMEHWLRTGSWEPAAEQR
jgi:2-hydroxychromene-2-carboxylate isomerase